MTKAARKRAAEPLGIHAQRKLSVIALHGGNARFDKSWTSILANAFFTPSITIDEIIAELPEIQKL